MKGWPSRFMGPIHAVIVTTKTDQTIRGLLVDKTRQYLTLRPASIAGQDPNNPGSMVWTRLDGDIVIPMENVDFWQEGVEAQLAGLNPEIYG